MYIILDLNKLHAINSCLTNGATIHKITKQSTFNPYYTYTIFDRNDKPVGDCNTKFKVKFCIDNTILLKSKCGEVLLTIKEFNIAVCYPTNTTPIFDKQKYDWHRSLPKKAKWYAVLLTTGKIYTDFRTVDGFNNWLYSGDNDVVGWCKLPNFYYPMNTTTSPWQPYVEESQLPKRKGDEDFTNYFVTHSNHVVGVAVEVAEFNHNTQEFNLNNVDAWMEIPPIVFKPQ